MYLERLELVGFKSFAQKTVLEFPAGVTAIVGPNGSGKSNIIDAIRWLLGEREAKNIRGAKAEDIIFAGTPARARLGMAQAVIVFNNKNHFFPVDYTEVSVRRRIGRDGDAKTFLNEAEMRLKDIIDFFAKARLGTKGFTIIGQGESDLFVRAAPKERRMMLEEILGLRQYELKRHEAEQKLNHTRVNMDKVKALVLEITPHLRLLRRQTARWEKHAELEQELRTLEDQFFTARLAELTEAYRKLEPELRALEAEIEKKAEEKHGFEKKLKEVEGTQPKNDTEFVEMRAKQNALLERRVELGRELGKLDAQLELQAREPHGARDAGPLLEMVIETRKIVKQALEESDFVIVRGLLKVLLGKLDQAAPQEKGKGEMHRPALAASKASLEKNLALLDEELRALRARESERTEGLQDFTGAFKRAYEALEEKKNDIAALEHARDKIKLENERISFKEQELHHQIRQALRNPDEFKEKAVPQEEIDFAAVERRILRLRGELASIGEIDEALLKETKETEERHVFLSRELEDLEAAAKDLHVVISELTATIHRQFKEALHAINAEFSKYIHTMFIGGRAKLVPQAPAPKPEGEAASGEGTAHVPAESEAGGEALEETGLDIEISIPRKKIHSLEMLSGGERSLVSLAVLFALISVSPPPFLVLDEVDAALDEENSRRFSELVKQFEKKTQFVIVTHNRATMEAADILYGVTMGDDGTSRVLSLKLEQAEEAVATAH